MFFQTRAVFSEDARYIRQCASISEVCLLRVGFLCFALHTRAEVSGAEILYDNLDDQEQVVVNCPTGFSGSLDLTCQKGVILTEGHLGMRLDQLS